MGSGVPSGLQNQYEGLRASRVSSILTRSRHEYKQPLAFCKWLVFLLSTNHIGFIFISSSKERDGDGKNRCTEKAIDRYSTNHFCGQ